MRAQMQMTETKTAALFQVELAKTADDLRKIQRLRYDVFVAELGGTGPHVDHAARLERDRFDDHAKHLMLRDLTRPSGQDVVGVYRLLTQAGAATAGQFYCESEYNLSVLRSGGKRLLELGRSCLHRDYRGGPGLMHLWGALSDYVGAHQIEVLFGVASFHGTDLDRVAAQLSLLYHHYRAPEASRTHAIGPTAQRMDLIPRDAIDRVAAMRDMPALIKAYLRLGGMVGDGAFIDHAFNTIDVCLILPTDAVPAPRLARLAKGKLHRG
ncbi:GNAT family N-acyltransferase [Cognatiyoonia sp. IB215446]|uniref:GNAT family N-acetyltransferase n=1 Tax=Cognatiyoonia sp. IB215446 TaxID=3097355 RepID=UPI002A10E95D|nr:GNAT family N-acyltransferase [Cognatiyoonia sp. IB215446]MDX8348642.1 GNAT family N-acyltransferase [Cognatiyoonia sp. IB215446]